MPEKLKPCPFCGYKARYYFAEEDHGKYGQIHPCEHHVLCLMGDCSAELGGHSKESVIAGWNTRRDIMLVDREKLREIHGLLNAWAGLGESPDLSNILRVVGWLAALLKEE